MVWENKTGGVFSEGAFWLPKAWATLFCANFNNAYSHPSGKWPPYPYQHLRLPSSHPYVLFPGEALLSGRLLLHHLYFPHAGEPPLRKKRPSPLAVLCRCSLAWPWGQLSVCSWARWPLTSIWLPVTLWDILLSWARLPMCPWQLAPSLQGLSTLPHELHLWYSCPFAGIMSSIISLVKFWVSWNWLVLTSQAMYSSCLWLRHCSHWYPFSWLSSLTH